MYSSLMFLSFEKKKVVIMTQIISIITRRSPAECLPIVTSVNGIILIQSYLHPITKMKSLLAISSSVIL